MFNTLYQTLITITPSNKIIMKFIALTAVFCLIAVTHAHMGLSPQEVVAGSRVEFDLRISHDCGDDTVGTTNFTVELPMDPPIFSVKVHQVPIWRVFINKVPLDPPVTMGKYTFNEAVKSINYIGFLPDGFYMTYKIRGMMPMVTNKTTVWVKGYQDCHNQGNSLAWNQIPNANNTSPRYPARSITIMPKEE